MQLISSCLFCLLIHHWWKWFELKYCGVYPKLFKRSASVDIIRVSRCGCVGGEQTTLTKQSLLKGMYVWGVNSVVTKPSDYFVWKESSERVARRCDDTVDKKQVNSWVLRHLCGGSSGTKNTTKPPIIYDLSLVSCFQSFATPEKNSFLKPCFAQF